MQQEFGSVYVPMKACLEVQEVHLKVIIRSYQVIMVFTHYQGCFGDRGITSLTVIYPYFLGSIGFCFHIDSPLYFFVIIHDVLYSFIFRVAKIICFGVFFKLDSLWKCYFIAYMILYLMIIRSIPERAH